MSRKLTLNKSQICVLYANNMIKLDVKSATPGMRCYVLSAICHTHVTCHTTNHVSRCVTSGLLTEICCTGLHPLSLFCSAEHSLVSSLSHECPFTVPSMSILCPSLSPLCPVCHCWFGLRLSLSSPHCPHKTLPDCKDRVTALSSWVTALSSWVTSRSSRPAAF